MCRGLIDFQWYCKHFMLLSLINQRLSKMYWPRRSLTALAERAVHTGCRILAVHSNFLSNML